MLSIKGFADALGVWQRTEAFRQYYYQCPDHCSKTTPVIDGVNRC